MSKLLFFRAAHLTFLALIFSWVGGPALSHACSCMEPPKVAQAVAEASAVFVGRVVNIGKNPLRESKKEVKFIVTRYLKGLDEIPGDNVIVYTAQNSAECGIEFVYNGEYLVYVTGVPANYQTNICSRTKPLELVLAEVKEVARLTAPKE